MAFNRKLLADKRTELRYSQRGLAEVAGVKSSFIAAAEAGNSKNPGYIEIRKIARVLGVDPDDFFTHDADSYQQAVAEPAAS